MIAIIKKIDQEINITKVITTGSIQDKITGFKMRFLIISVERSFGNIL